MRHSTLKLLGACAVLGLSAGLASAQRVTPPSPSGDPKPPVVMTWATVLLAGGAVLIAATLPSKRGHQD